MGSGLPDGKSKVLIIIDQFEQWLHAHRSGDGRELVNSLKNCNGRRVQVIISVRDDFYMASTRFMAELGVEMRQDSNWATMDLFGERHAKKVLKLFGQSYGALPTDDENMTDEQKEFLDQSVHELAREDADGRIAPVRLSLFAQMLSEKEWTPLTLQSVGGAKGVGVRFLEETFDTDRGRIRHNIGHSDLRPCRLILKALLPDLGMGIKGGRKSELELLKSSGLERAPDRFRRLIGMLDGELRMITPTASEEVEGESATVLGEQIVRYYQLTHDYLVPSIREWLTRKQRGTRRGRAELLLAEISSLWNAKPKNRHLPSPLEWTNIGLLTKKKDWTEPQRKMMMRAGWVYGVLGLCLVAILLLLGLGIYEFNGRNEAQRLRDKLLGSPLSEVPSVIAELSPYRRWVDQLLRQTYAEAKEAEDSQKQLYAALALLPVDDNQLPYLRDRLLRADAQNFSVIRQSLAGHKDAIVAECWRVLQKPTLEDQGKALQAASALALYDPENPLWEKLSTDVANRLVAENAYVVARWINALRPVSKQIRDPLIAVFHDVKRGESERTQAASALGEYLSEKPKELAGLLIDATEKQFAALYPSVERRSDPTAPLLEVELSRKPPSITGEIPTDVDNKALDRFYKRQANAATALIRMGRAETLWSLLKHSPDPSLRSYLVNRLGPWELNPVY